MKQLELLPEIKRLCVKRDYDSAIKLCDEIEIHDIAVRARLLCVAHEKATSEIVQNNN